jgi:hypothetical protein
MLHEVEFIPAEWLERSCWAARQGQSLLCYSRTIAVEHRVHARRSADVVLLIQSILRSTLLPKAA